MNMEVAKVCKHTNFWAFLQQKDGEEQESQMKFKRMETFE